MTNNIKVVGQMAICKHPMWKTCLTELCKHVDEVYIRFDLKFRKYQILSHIPIVCGSKLKSIVCYNVEWNKFNWREDLIRMLDNAKPDIVLSLDEDEIFENTIDSDIINFHKSEKCAAMFNYYAPMPTKDGSIILDGKPYPSSRHMKMFKWKAGLTYLPYKGNAKLSNYENPQTWYLSDTKIKHYSLYDERIYKKKKKLGLKNIGEMNILRKSITEMDYENSIFRWNT